METKESYTLAAEIAKRLKATSKAKDIAIICLTVALVAITVWLTSLNYVNDCNWREFAREITAETEE